MLIKKFDTNYLVKNEDGSFDVIQSKIEFLGRGYSDFYVEHKDNQLYLFLNSCKISNNNVSVIYYILSQGFTVDLDIYMDDEAEDLDYEDFTKNFYNYLHTNTSYFNMYKKICCHPMINNNIPTETLFDPKLKQHSFYSNNYVYTIDENTGKFELYNDLEQCIQFTSMLNLNF